MAPVDRRRWWRPTIYLVPLALFVAAYWTDVVPPPADQARPVAEVGTVGTALDWTAGQVPRTTYAMTQATIVPGTYLRMMIWPTGQSVDHDFVPAESFSAAVALGLLLMVGLLTCGYLVRKREPLVTLAIVIGAVTLLPTSSLMPNTEFVAEHRAYLALAGFAMIAAALAMRMPQARQQGAVAVVAALILAVATSRRAYVWADQARLWRDATAKTEWVPRPPYALGSVYQARGDYAAAEAAYKLSLERAPGYEPALYNLSLVYELQTHYRAAFELNLRWLRHHPRAPVAIENLIRLAFKMNDLGLVKQAVGHGLELDRQRPSFRLAAARLALREGDAAACVDWCRELLADSRLSDADRLAVRALLDKATRPARP